MYALYRKQFDNKEYQYTRLDEPLHLFGSRVGLIPKLLKANIEAGQLISEKWRLEIAESMGLIKQPEIVPIISLKPKNSKPPNLSLYEIVDIWGYSYSDKEFTPIMFYLRGLYCDADPKNVIEEKFIRNSNDIEDPIFSIMYLHGTIKDNKITGKWTTPGQSSTNAVLLWQDAFEHFSEKANEVIANTNTKNKLIT